MEPEGYVNDEQVQAGAERQSSMKVPGSLPRIALIGIGLAAVVLGCSRSSSDGGGTNPLTTGMCTADLVPTVIVEVRDRVTGTPAACGATGEVQDGDQVAPLTDLGRCATDPETTVDLYGPFASRGNTVVFNYTVSIRKPGYQDWVRNGVIVTSLGCDVHTVTLQAFLDPS